MFLQYLDNGHSTMILFWGSFSLLNSILRQNRIWFFLTLVCYQIFCIRIHYIFLFSPNWNPEYGITYSHIIVRTNDAVECYIGTFLVGRFYSLSAFSHGCITRYLLASSSTVCSKRLCACFVNIDCVSKKPDTWEIFKYLQQSWTNINNFWYRESSVNMLRLMPTIWQYVVKQRTSLGFPLATRA